MIKNLIRPSLAEAGKIKIGGLGETRKSKRGGEYRLPQKYDHFVVTKTTKDENDDFEVDADIMQALSAASKGGPIREIPIVLHSDEIDLVFPTSLALYTGKRCACRGDGETARRREIKDDRYTGNEKTIKCPCPYLNAETGPRCKPNGKLYCSIAVPGRAVAGAVHIWRTTSIISIQQMIGSLEQIKAVAGTMRGLPLALVVKPIRVEPAGGVATTVYVCHVELRARDLEQVQAAALRAAEMRRRLGNNDAEYRALLQAPGVGETDEDQADISGEFYPENHADLVTIIDDRPGTSPADLERALENNNNPEHRDAVLPQGDAPFGPAE